MQLRILVATDDPVVRNLLVRELAPKAQVLFVDCRMTAFDVLEARQALDAVVADSDMGLGEEAIEVLDDVRRCYPRAIRLLIGGPGSERMAYQAMRARVAHGHVFRPWRMGSVLERLHEMCAERSRPIAMLLVADDDEAFCEHVRSWVSDDYEVTVTHDGEEALRAARVSRPDIVLLDAALPKLGGLSVAWALRTDPRFKGIPVILTEKSTPPYASRANVQQGEPALVDGCLRKPLSRELLLDPLQRLLASPAATRPMEPEHRPTEEWAVPRLTPRVGVQIKGRLAALGVRSDAVVTSLSPRGGYVECALQLPVGTPGTLTFDWSSAHFETGCRTLYWGCQGGRRGLGLRFERLSPEGERVLVQALSAQAPP